MDNFFQEYETAFDGWTGTKPHQRSSRLSVSNTGDPGVVGPPAVASLYDAMSNSPWSEPVEGGRPSNWRWREPSSCGSKEPGAEANGDTDDPSEVALERAIVATAGHENWTYQMSTSSGMGSKQQNKRRAIDLVTRIDDDTYRFTELKLNRGTPLFAIREILGYGLAYLHTRRCIAQSHKAKAWMRATNVELAVLGPTDWYDGYVGRLCPAAELRWLVEAINHGLHALSQRFDGLSRLVLELRAFERAPLDRMANAIANARDVPYSLETSRIDRVPGA